MIRRVFLIASMVALTLFSVASVAQSASADARAADAMRAWYRLVLDLVRHTPTYSPPVASRSFAYIGIAAFESVASGSAGLVTLSGQLNAMPPMPAREADKAYDDAVVVNATIAHAVGALFENTGPTGQRAIGALTAKLRASVREGVAEDVAARSQAYGEAVAARVLEWAGDDGGAIVENMGFPYEYKLNEGPAHWVPTSLVAQQQVPLLPKWGANRTFALENGATCALPPPPEFSDAPDSQFYKEAREVFDTVRNLTAEQEATARFWSDDPMLSATPPGHWMTIALGIAERDQLDLERSADLFARLAIALSDSFVACWNAKYVFDLVRPVSYIRRLIDPQWSAILNTPPFPEYPSGHSTQSAAAATVLTALLGNNFAFEDDSKTREGMKARSYASFWDAANEAGISRLYGGIHFRAAIERGLDQGRCIGAHINALKTRR
jgi:hypothetical protein